MLKAIIIFCAYLTTITTSTLGDPSSISCAAISCPSPSGCIDGLGCTKLCGTTASGTSTAICTDPKECVASNCVETCTSADECSAYPYAECSTKTINAESADICVPAIPTVTCEENETYYTVQDCKTCDGICNIDPFCTLSCRAGCYCDPGYVRDDYGGDCILEDECPTDLPSTTDPSNNCGDNEEYNECSSYCPESCTRPSGFTACPAICGPARCECMDGYVRNEFAECVLPDDCPTTMTPTCLGENKEYDTCGSYCPKSCNNLLYFDTIACVDMCVEGCFCKDGYVLDIEGNCVMEEDCDELDMSSTTTDAPSGCEIIDCDTSGGEVCAEDDGSGSAGCVVIGDTCEGCFRLGMPCGTCPDDINSFGACDGCTWQETYIGAKCADTISQCPDPTCEENEEVSNCNGHCRPTCETGEFIFCTLQCEPGCNCKEDYILDEKDGVCIPIEDCPTTIEPSTIEPSTTDMASTDEIGTPGDVCGLPVDGDCDSCRAQCGTCSDGTQWGCCGECYYDEDGETCTGFKPRECPGCDDITCETGEECVEDSDGIGNAGCVEDATTIEPTTTDEEVVTCGGFENCASYNDDCNDCTCGDTGLAACTRVGCDANNPIENACTSCIDGYTLTIGECIEDFQQSSANAYGLMLVMGVILSVFGWM
eukprot:CAMPEP_0201577772 /NCGR_PEP_ID=MMETSP0190_2-20130828/24271_1 /ASSEMBLY_ACC=CAM_ASM_000263 /TAXON_ID=37353 /ORGANISM="Rosalina sp." /LENGTH=654 /DNA_ID=CAMNT_0048010147 /DNA_START=54 /DNA_END=2018 /DNA_ORIENTATION=-